MDLLDVNSFTNKLKFRKLLRNAWTEVTGMVSLIYIFFICLITMLQRKVTLIVKMVLEPWTGPGFDHHLHGSLAFRVNI